MSTSYSVKVLDGGQRIALAGALRPVDHRSMSDVREALSGAMTITHGELCLDMKRLTHMNHVALVELARSVKGFAECRPGLGVKLVISSVIPWAIRRFQTLGSAFPNVVVDVYDRAMYPSQQVLEHEAFVGVLRTQDEAVWNLESRALARHGLREKMRVADVACGVGGFAVWLAKAFRPEVVVGIDHSKASLRAAQAYAKQESAGSVDFCYGEATALLLPDSSFDFVSCRLALQISPAADRIARELYRICKPGGRVYVTNELLASATGYPNEGAIRGGCGQIHEIFSKLGGDLNSGLRAVALLRAAGLEDIRYEPLVLDVTNTERAKLAKIFNAWNDVVEDLCRTADASPEARRTAINGIEAMHAAALDPSGYVMWPIIAVSGRKPAQGA